MTPQAKTCQGCKIRHRKCSTQTPCEGCLKAGITCQRTVNYNFKVYSGSHFGNNQPWIDSEETISLAKDDGSDWMVSHGFTSPVSLFPDICVGQDEEPNAHEYSFPSSPEHDLLPKNIGSLGVVSPLNSISSSQLQHGQFPLSETDAALTRHFLRVLSPWFDYCDSRRQFIGEVSGRLSCSAALLKAVLAVSAQHLSAFGQFDPNVSDRYYQTALENLTSVTSASHVALNEEMLAATVILRLQAEFEVPLPGIDNQYYLVGTQTLLEEYRTFHTLSEFQIALAWIGLRQELRVAVMAQRPVCFPLDCLYIDWNSTPRDDAEWAQRMMLHLAEVLNYCYGTAAKIETYKILTARSQEWRELKPPSFTPLFSQPSDETTRFPRCEFVNDAVVMGLQHYNLSKIVLALHHPSSQLRPGDTYTMKMINQIIDGSIRKLCGIGFWNPDCACAIGLACTGIILWGDRFQDPEDQKAFQSVLDLAKEKHAWRA